MNDYCSRCGGRKRVAGTSGRFCECSIGLCEYRSLTSEEIFDIYTLGIRHHAKTVDWYITISLGWLRFKLKAKRFFRRIANR